MNTFKIENVQLRAATGVLLAPEQREDFVFAETVLTNFPAANGSEGSRHDLEKLLVEQLKDKLPKGRVLYCSDESYYFPTVDECILIWAASKVQALTYKTERFDCDDFAMVLKGEFSRYAYVCNDWGRRGIAVGIAAGDFAWSGPNHMTNVFVDELGAVHFFEPATGPQPIERCVSVDMLIF